MGKVDEEDSIQKALEFATVAHGSQKRKYTDEPYIVHPINVMETLQKLGFHYTVLQAALLHDTVEDTDTTIQDIEQNFGITVARIVDDLTDVYTAKKFPKIGRKYRKMLECYRLLRISGTAKSIKLADLVDNTKSIVEYDKDFAHVYLKEKQEMLYVLEGGDQRLMEMAVKSLLNEVIKKELL